MNDAKVSLAVGGIALVVATSALVLALVVRSRTRLRPRKVLDALAKQDWSDLKVSPTWTTTTTTIPHQQPADSVAATRRLMARLIAAQLDLAPSRDIDGELWVRRHDADRVLREES